MKVGSCPSLLRYLIYSLQVHDARQHPLAYQTVRRRKVYCSHGNIILCSQQDFNCNTSLAVITSLTNVPVKLNSVGTATASDMI